jgi:hypothetical protein
LTDFFTGGIPEQNQEYVQKRTKIMITLYGPYGDFKSDLEQICKILRDKYGYDNCKLVSERETEYLSVKDKEKDKDILNRNRSFYFLEVSHVIIFVFFCDKKELNKISHSESPSSELTYLLDLLKHKMKCYFIFKEKGCEMSSVWFGHAKGEGLKYEETTFKNNEEIAKMIKAKCTIFLEEKYHEII